MLYRVYVWLLGAALVLSPALASAQSPIRAFPPGSFQNRAALDAGSTPAFSISFGTEKEDTTTQTTYTLSSVNIGTAATNRFTVIAICLRAAVLLTTPTVTVDPGGGAITATKVVEENTFVGGATSYSALFQVSTATTSGTTATIVISAFTGAAVRAAVQPYAVYTSTSAIPSGGAIVAATIVGSTMTGSVTVPTGGLAIVALCGANLTSTSITAPASGITQDYSAVIGASTTLTQSGHDTTTRSGATTYTITANATTANTGAVFAAWAP